MKLAIFKSMNYGVELVSESSEFLTKEYVRISEYVDVEFPMLDNTDVTKNQIDSLRKAKQDIQAATELKLQDIDLKISKLLALPHKED